MKKTAKKERNTDRADLKFHARLDQMLKKRDIKELRLARAIVRPQSTITKLKQTKNSPPSVWVPLFAQELGCSPEWLAWGVGPQDAHDDSVWEIAKLVAARPILERAELLVALSKGQSISPSPSKQSGKSLAITIPLKDVSVLAQFCVRRCDKLDVESLEFQAVLRLLSALSPESVRQHSIMRQDSKFETLGSVSKGAGNDKEPVRLS